MSREYIIADKKSDNNQKVKSSKRKKKIFDVTTPIRGTDVTIYQYTHENQLTNTVSQIKQDSKAKPHPRRKKNQNFNIEKHDKDASVADDRSQQTQDIQMSEEKIEEIIKVCQSQIDKITEQVKELTKGKDKYATAKTIVKSAVKILIKILGWLLPIPFTSLIAPLIEKAYNLFMSARRAIEIYNDSGDLHKDSGDQQEQEADESLSSTTNSTESREEEPLNPDTDLEDLTDQEDISQLQKYAKDFKDKHGEDGERVNEIVDIIGEGNKIRKAISYDRLDQINKENDLYATIGAQSSLVKETLEMIAPEEVRVLNNNPKGSKKSGCFGGKKKQPKPKVPGMQSQLEKLIGRATNDRQEKVNTGKLGNKRNAVIHPLSTKTDHQRKPNLNKKQLDNAYNNTKYSSNEEEYDKVINLQ